MCGFTFRPPPPQKKGENVPKLLLVVKVISHNLYLVFVHSQYWADSHLHAVKFLVVLHQVKLSYIIYSSAHSAHR